MGSAGVSPAQANAVLKQEGDIDNDTFQTAIESNTFLAAHHNFIHENSNKSNGYITLI